MMDPARGVGFMLLASFFFALMTAFVKLLGAIPVLEIIFFRSLISLALCFWGIRRARVAMLGNNRRLLMIRGLAGVAALTMNFYLIQQIPLATASTLTHLAPIFTTLIGMWVLKEHVKPVQLLFFGLSFTGVLLIQGFDVRVSILHLCIGITTSIVMAVAYSCVRKLSADEHPLVIIFYFPLITIPVSGIWTMFNWALPTTTQWIFIIGVGVTTQIAQYFMTRAYQAAEVATVSIVNYTGIVYAIVLGFILFGETYNLITYLGMALVVSGILMNVLFKKSLQ